MKTYLMSVHIWSISY